MASLRSCRPLTASIRFMPQKLVSEYTQAMARARAKSGDKRDTWTLWMPSWSLGRSGAALAFFHCRSRPSFTLLVRRFGESLCGRAAAASEAACPPVRNLSSSREAGMERHGEAFATGDVAPEPPKPPTPPPRPCQG